MIRDVAKRTIREALVRSKELLQTFAGSLLERQGPPLHGRVAAPSEDRSSPAGSHAAPPLRAAERRAFIRKRLEDHKQDYLRYEVGLLGVERRLSPSLIRGVLDGEDAVSQAPSLALATDDWAWQAGEIERLILAEADSLHLTIPAGGSLVDARASRACRDWARAEARRRVDRALAGAARGM